jgi:hypothetical protein
VTVSDGNGGNNYNVSYANNTTSTINQANLTIGTSNVTRNYNGTLAAAGTATVTAGTLYGSDSISGGTFAFTNANAGTNKTVVTSGVTVSDGNSGNNYNVSYANNTTSTINAAPITVSTNAVTKVFDGNTSAAGSAVVTSGSLYTNASNGNTPDTLVGGTFTYDTAAVGTNKTVNVSGVTINDGNAGNNYILTLAPNTSSVILASAPPPTPPAQPAPPEVENVVSSVTGSSSTSTVSTVEESSVPSGNVTVLTQSMGGMPEPSPFEFSSDFEATGFFVSGNEYPVQETTIAYGPGVLTGSVSSTTETTSENTEEGGTTGESEQGGGSGEECSEDDSDC